MLSVVIIYTAMSLTQVILLSHHAFYNHLLMDRSFLKEFLI